MIVDMEVLYTTAMIELYRFDIADATYDETTITIKNVTVRGVTIGEVRIRKDHILRAFIQEVKK